MRRRGLENPDIVVRDGQPVAVMLDIDVYRDMLERLEDAEDLAVLAEMRREPLDFKCLDDFLAECTL
jgi:hypothetical protein